MKQNMTLVPGEEVLDQIPANSIKEITTFEEGTMDGKRLIRTTGGSLWLAMKNARFETFGLELVFRGHLQQYLEVPVRVRQRLYRPAIKC